MKLLFIGGAVLVGGILLGSSNSKSKMVDKILNSSRLSSGEKEHFKNNVFPYATKEEVSYLHQVLVKGIKPINEEQRLLHLQLSKKYNIFT